jgi:hypothetical protein
MSVLPPGALGALAPDKELGELIIRALAVAGAALVGGLASGLLLQVLVRMTTTARVPKGVLRVTRILGAVALALAAALFLFNQGSGLGGGGWGWFGAGPGSGGGGPTAPAESTARETPAPRDTGREPGTAPAGPGRILRVEVLVDRRNPATAFRPEGRSDLLSLADLEKYVAGRQAQAPGLQRLELVLYLNSPDRDSGPVKELLAWARREGLETSIDTPSTNAP